MSLVSNLGRSVEKYLLNQIAAARYPLKNYRIFYEPVSDNSLQVKLNVARGISGLFVSRTALHDILDNLEKFKFDLLHYLERRSPEYNIYLEDPVSLNQTLVFTITYYPKVELPPDIIKKILSYLHPEEAQRTALSKEYQRAFEDQYIWYMFVMNTYGPYYRFLREVPLDSVNWRQLYQEIERLKRSGTPMVFDNFLFKEAISQNAIELVKIMLMDPSIDPMDVGDTSPNDSPYLRVPIKLAAERNHLVILKMLLDDPRVDPNVGDSIALRVSLAQGAPEAAAMLLAHPKVKTTARILVSAILGNDYDLFEKVLSRVDPSEFDNLAVILASEKGRIEMVNRLLQDPRVDPSAQGNLPLRLASQEGRLNVIDRLLQDPRVNPADHGNATLIIAAHNGHVNVVNRLLQDPRVDPAAQGNAALLVAAQQNHPEVIARLLQDPRVDPLA